MTHSPSCSQPLGLLSSLPSTVCSDSVEIFSCPTNTSHFLISLFSLQPSGQDCSLRRTSLTAFSEPAEASEGQTGPTEHSQASRARGLQCCPPRGPTALSWLTCFSTLHTHCFKPPFPLPCHLAFPNYHPSLSPSSR